MSTFDPTLSTATTDAFLASEANHFYKDISLIGRYRSPWHTIFPKATFEPGDTAIRNSLIYNATLPKYEGDPGGAPGVFDTVGVKWNKSAASTESATDRAAGVIEDALKTAQGPQYNLSRSDQVKVLRPYELTNGSIASAYIDLDAIYSTTMLTTQLDAVKSNLADTAVWAWDQEYRDQYDLVVDNYLVALASSSAISTGHTGTAATGLALGTVGDPAANLSEALLDQIYTRLQLQGGVDGSYGMDEGAPVYCAMASPEAINRIKRESGTREDLRDSTIVDDLLKPLGVSQSLRGFMFVADFKAKRFTSSGTALTEVPAEIVTSGTDSSLIPNPAYALAPIEELLVVHKKVVESQVPAASIPLSGGVSFDRQDWLGNFEWSNIKSDQYNPFGTRGRFLGRLSHAVRPVRVDLGYAILFDRTSAVSAE